MRKSLAISAFLSLTMLACGSDTTNTNTANIANSVNAANTNVANTNIANTINNAVTNSPAANAPKVSEPENPTLQKESNTQTKINALKTEKETKPNSNTKNGKMNEENNPSAVINKNQNGALKKETQKIKKNVEKLLKELP